MNRIFSIITSAIISLFLLIILYSGFEETRTLLELYGTYCIYAAISPFILTILVCLITLLIPKKVLVNPDKPEIFFITLGHGLNYTETLTKPKHYILGSNHNSDIILDYPFIDKKHLLIKHCKNYVFAICLSEKAVHIDRQRMKKNKNYECKKGDYIQIGKIKINFQ